MGLTNILLYWIQHIAWVARAAVGAIADTIKAGLITVWHTLGAGAVQLETFGTFTDIRCNATSLIAAKCAHGLANTAHFQITLVAGAQAGCCTLAILTVVTFWLTHSTSRQAIPVETIALVGRHTFAIFAGFIAVRYAILAGGGFKREACFALALILGIANAIAATDGAGRDAFVLVIAHVAGNADAGVGRRANAIRAVVEADRIAA